MKAHIDGKEFTGVFYTIKKGTQKTRPDEEGEVHTECYHAYKGIVQEELTEDQKKNGEKCLHCKLAVMAGKINERVFNGRFYTIDKGELNSKKAGKVHMECFKSFKAARVDKCLHCSLPVMEPVESLQNTISD